MNKYFYYLIVILFTIGINLAHTLTLKSGSEYFYLGTGAREISLGYTGMSELGSMSGAAYNPATIGVLKRVANNLMLGGFGSDQAFIDLGIGIPTLAGVVLFNLTYLNGADANLTHWIGLNTAIGKPITENLYWGFGLKFGYGMIQETSEQDWALGADIGIIHNVSPSGIGFGLHNLSWGIGFKNIGKTVSFTATDPFPAMSLAIGGSVDLINTYNDIYKLKLLTDITFPFTPFSIVWGIGMEHVLFNLLKFRAGYLLNQYKVGPFSFGVGLSGKFGLTTQTPANMESQLTEIDLSYALQMQKFNNKDEFAHFVNLNIAWGYLDIKKPTVIAVPNYSYFSPNGDGSKDTIVYKLDIKDNTMVAGWKLEILDSKSNIVKSFQSQQEIKLKGLTIAEFFRQIFSLKEDVPIPSTLEWNGIDNEGTPVGDGKYFAQISAWDANKNLVVSKLSDLTIDTVVPQITVEADNLIFSPNGDGNKDTIIFNYTVHQLNTGDMITALIKNEKGQAIKNWIYTDNMVQYQVWDGLDDNGKPVPDGNYSFEITASDHAGNTSHYTIEQFKLVTRMPQVTLTATRNGFSPNNDGLYDYAVFHPQVDDTVGLQSWELNFTDENGQKVRTIKGSYELPTEITWDGRDNKGSMCADGVYNYQLSLYYDNGNIPKTQVGKIHLDSTPPLLTIEIPKNYVVLEDKSPQSVVIHHKNVIGDDNDKLVIKIYNTPNWESEDAAVLPIFYDTFTVKDWREGTSDNSDKYKNYEWSGRSSDLTPVPAGQYYYVVEATDELGNKKVYQAVQPIHVKVGYETLKITANAQAISPQGNGKNKFANFDFEISGTNGLTEFLFEIKDHKGRTVKSVHSDTFINSLTWDGTDQNGQPVPEGKYIYSATAKYGAYNQQTSSMEMQIIVDNTPPVINVQPKPEYELLAFSPNGDGQKELIRFNMEVKGDKDDLFLAFITAEGKVVKTLIDRKSGAELDNEINWDGKTDNNMLAPPGIYQLFIVGKDIAGNITQIKLSDIKLVREFENLDFKVQSQMGHYLAPSGNKKNLKSITFTSILSTNGKTIDLAKDYGLVSGKLEIFDEWGRLTKTFTINEQNYKAISWNGNSDFGSGLAPDGIYSATVTYIFDSGNKAVGTISNIILDRTPPALNMLLNPSDKFTPDGDGYLDNLWITLDARDTNGIESWNLDIYKVVRVVEKNQKYLDYIPYKSYSGKNQAENLTLKWDGVSDRPSEKVGSLQDYQVIFKASDMLGNSAAITNQFRSGVLISWVSNGFVIQMDSLNFEYNSARLVEEDMDKMAMVIKMLQEIANHPTDYRLTNDFVIQVIGHTDIQGSEKYNATLSTNRALTILNYLKKNGIPDNILTYVGYGESKPLYDVPKNLPTKEQQRLHALNRRVEFYIYMPAIKQKN